MKKIILILSSVVMLSLTTLFLESCNEGDKPQFLSVTRIATDLDVALDGSDVTNVPVNSSIILIFNKPIDNASVTAEAVAIQNADLSIVPSNREVKGDSVILTPLAPMALGSNYTVAVFKTLKGMNGASAKESEYNFKTFGRANATPPEMGNQVSYFPFTGNLKDEIGTHTPTVADVRDITFGTDRFGFEGMAGRFNGSTSIVEIPEGDLYMSNHFTLSLWIKANSLKNGQYILGLAAWKGFQLELAFDWSWVKFATQYNLGNGTSDSEDNWFPGTGMTKDNGGWVGTTFQKDVLPHGGGVGTTYFKDKWAHIVCTYNASTKLSTMYLNGEKVNQFDFDLWPVGDSRTGVTGLKFAGNLTGGGNKLALGFIQGSSNRIIIDDWANPADLYSYHFQGLMDDLRFFKVALSEADVAALYAAEKP